MKRPSATLIGVFVLGALALIAAAILFFGGGAVFKQRFTAVSYFPGSVAGLQIGAPVTYRGVRVGQVKSVGIRIDPEPTHSIVQVNMELAPEAVQGHGNSSTQDGASCTYRTRPYGTACLAKLRDRDASGGARLSSRCEGTAARSSRSICPRSRRWRARSRRSRISCRRLTSRPL